MLAGNRRKGYHVLGLSRCFRELCFHISSRFKKKWLGFVDLLKGLGFSSCGHEKAAIVGSRNRCVATRLMDGPATLGPVAEL